MSKASSIKPKGHHKAPKSAESSEGTLVRILLKYNLALQRASQSEPADLSVKDQYPEYRIKSWLQELFADTRIRERRDWVPMNPLSIRRAFAKCIISTKSDKVAEEFELLREIVLPCYRTADLCWMDARQLANGEDLGIDFHGFVLTQRQIQSVTTTLPDAQQAMQGIIYMADMWPMHFMTPESIAHFRWCLETMAQLLKDRGAKKIQSLDKALGFSASGKGNSSDGKKMKTMNSWNDRCFDIHLLVLSGLSIDEASARYVDGEGTRTKSKSGESLGKMYGRWCKEPVTAVRLHLGDPLAKRILFLPDVQELINERFPLVSR